MVGLSRFELLTPRLSSVCSNQLSYRPKPTRDRTPQCQEPETAPVLSKLDRTCVQQSAVCQVRKPGRPEYQIDHFKLSSPVATGLSTRRRQTTKTLERR